MAGLGQGGRSGVRDVRPGGPPSRSIADPVAERRRDAMLLLRKHQQHPSRVVSYQLDAILWLDQHGRPCTTFVTEVGGAVKVGRPFDGFVV